MVEQKVRQRSRESHMTKAEPQSAEGTWGGEGNVRGLLGPRPPRQGVELTDHSMCPPGTRKRPAVPSHTQAVTNSIYQVSVTDSG